jgi:hypothetical protein
LSFNKGYE